MSFGFSIGDIVLLSKLAYDLYSSVSDGRRAASGDLQELESVLFSLRCALDHLGDVSKDILTKSGQSDGSPAFTDKLDKMMNSCKATLQELDDVTKKYRELGIDSKVEATQPGGKKKRMTFEETKKKIRVNWTKIRWDQEKRSLQWYREKLKSHTDAIQIIVISTLWSRIDTAEKTSIANHNKTQKLLEDIHTNSGTDSNMVQLIQEIHTHLIQPQPSLARGASGTPRPAPKPLDSSRISSRLPRGDVGINNLAAFSGGGSTMASIFSASGPGMLSVDPSYGSSGYTSMAMEADAFIPTKLDDITLEEVHLESSFAYMSTNLIGSMQPNKDVLVPGKEPRVSNMSIRPKSQAKEGLKLSPEIVKLNNKRRTVGIKEYEAYQRKQGQLQKMYTTPKPKPNIPVPAALPPPPSVKDTLSELFRPLENNGIKQALAASERRGKEVTWWMQEFRDFARDCKDHNTVVDLLVNLNEAMEHANPKIKRVFYAASDGVGFIGILESLQKETKSARVRKEIEEFGDSREDWEDEMR